jgi:hypothetical protein
MSHIAATHPRVTKAWADTGYRTKAIDHGARLGIDVEVVQREPGAKGFKVNPRRDDRPHKPQTHPRIHSQLARHLNLEPNNLARTKRSFSACPPSVSAAPVRRP